MYSNPERSFVIIWVDSGRAVNGGGLFGTVRMSGTSLSPSLLSILPVSGDTYRDKANKKLAVSMQL